MKELIHIHNQGPDLMADSRDIATLFDVTHEHLRELAEANRAYLEQLGQFRFETGTGKKLPQGGGTPVKFLYLNFDQIVFLLTLTKPREATKDFKFKLVFSLPIRAREIAPD